MAWKDTTHHINNFNPGRTCLKQYFVKNMKRTFTCLLPKYQRERKREQEAGDDLSFCVLKLLPEVNTLPNLVAISLVRVKI